MKRNDFRIALLVLLYMAAVHCANAAPVNQKNIYLAVEAFPSAAGVVYADVKPADSKYAKDKTGWGAVSSVKATLQQNGTDANELGMYEAVVSAKANEDYEFVCYSYECYTNDRAIYLWPDIMLEASGFDSGSRTDDLFASDNWSESPDITVYAIFRKKGDLYPTIDLELDVEEVECEPQTLNGKAYNLQGIQVGEDYKGIVIVNGKKFLRK